MDSRKDSTSDSSSEADFFLEKQLSLSPRHKVWPWIATTTFFAILSIALFFKPAIEKSCMLGIDAHSEPSKPQVWRRSDFGTYDVLIPLCQRRPLTDFSLILAAAREVIELEDVQFTGNSAYDDNGRFYVNNPSPINYKDATPEADDAWKNLTLTGRMYPLFLP